MKYDPAVDLVPVLAHWMTQHETRLFKTPKKDHEKIYAFQLERARSIFEGAKKSGAIEVLFSNELPIALFAFMRPKKSRARGERVLFYQYDNGHQNEVRPWLSVMFEHYAELAPKNSRLTVYPWDIDFFSSALVDLGFKVRYDILRGDTEIALRALKEKKSPPKNLDHLDLKIKELKTSRDVEAALKVQKEVFSKIPEHGNFSHTRAQLERDREEYCSTIKDRSGKILGIYRGKKMMGFMGAFVQTIPGAKEKMGGLTLCLAPEIQGKGVAKTGYLILLQYLKSKKVRSFYGGTSRTEIKGLGKIMKRKLVLAHLVKT